MIKTTDKNFEYSNARYFGSYRRTGQPYNPYKAREEAKKKEGKYGFRKY